MLYRFKIDLSDVDRNIYETLDFRVSQHPSETLPYLLSRVLAFVLSYHKGLDFSAGGLSDPDAPALQSLGAHNSVDTWIEIGNPSARKLHKATKTAREVIVYTYKNPDVLINEIKNNDVHRASEIKIYAFDSKFIETLEKKIEKNNQWSLLVQQGHLDLSVGDQTMATDVQCKSV